MKRIQVPAVMVTGLTTEKVENVRIVLLTTVKAGIVRIARDLMPTMKEANARSVRMVTALMATVPNVLLTIVKGGDRPYRPRFNNNNEGGERPQRSYNREGGSYDRPQRPSYNREGGSYDRPQRPRFNSGEGSDRPQRPSYNREGGDRPYRPRFNNGEGGGYRSNNGGGGYRPRYNNDRSQGGYRPRPRTGDYDPNAKYSVKKQIEYKEQFIDPNEPIRLNKFWLMPVFVHVARLMSLSRQVWFL